jgi:hypothetical protein
LLLEYDEGTVDTKTVMSIKEKAMEFLLPSLKKSIIDDH